MFDTKLRSLVAKLGTYIPTLTKDEVRFNCPFCIRTKTADNKYHLYLHVARDSRQGSWICHRCNYKGRSIDSLASKVLLDTNGETVTVNILSLIRDILTTNDNYSPKEPKIELPPCEVISNNVYIAFEYCKSRGLSISDIEFYDLRFGTGKYVWRIIIPNRSNNGEGYNFWQGRWYHPIDNQNVIRYLSAPGSHKSLVLFNYYNCIGLDSIIICEGPFSAMIAGRNAVCTFGKSVSPYQLKLLLDLSAREYIIAFDGDAVPEAVALSTTLSMELGCRTKLVLLEHGEDPASIGHDNISRLIESTKSYDVYDQSILSNVEKILR